MALSRDDVKQSGREALRAELEYVGAERARDRYTDALLPITLRAAQAGGLRLTGMSTAVGLSRQGTYDAMAREVSDTVRDADLEPLIAAAVAAAAPIDVASLADSLRLDPKRVFSVLHALLQRDLVQFAGSAGYDNFDMSVWRVTDAGVEWLADRRRSIGWAPEYTAVYFVVEDPREIRSLSGAVEEIVGRDRCSLLRAGTTSSPFDEIAIAIPRGEDRKLVLRNAYEIWDQARALGGLSPRLPRVADIAW